MSDHPSIDALGRYRAGDLPPAELLAIDAHLADCAECRARGLAAIEAVGEIRAALAASHDAHVAYEMLEAYTDGTLAPDERETVESHLSVCQACCEDVGDLRRVRAELSVEASSGSGAAEGSWFSRWLSWRGVMGSLAALGAAAAIAWFVAPGSDSTQPVEERIANDATSAPPRLELRDGALALTVAADGRLTGLPPDLPTAMRDRAEQVLASGRLASAPVLEELRGPAGALMGSDPGAAVFGPVSPVATVVESDRPLFRWTPHPAASAYRVTVFDSRFEEVADSGELTGTSWTPGRPLPRGVTLSWQIAARTDRGVVQAPVPPAPEARFRVVDDALLSSIEAARAGGSHLLLAIAYSQAGLVEAAAAELNALGDENPGSPIVAALSSSLRPDGR